MFTLTSRFVLFFFFSIMIRSYGVDDLMSKIGSLKITIEFAFFYVYYTIFWI